MNFCQRNNLQLQKSASANYLLILGFVGVFDFYVDNL